MLDYQQGSCFSMLIIGFNGQFYTKVDQYYRYVNQTYKSSSPAWRTWFEAPPQHNKSVLHIDFGRIWKTEVAFSKSNILCLLLNSILDQIRPDSGAHYISEMRQYCESDSGKLKLIRYFVPESTLTNFHKYSTHIKLLTLSWRSFNLFSLL